MPSGTRRFGDHMAANTVARDLYHKTVCKIISEKYTPMSNHNLVNYDSNIIQFEQMTNNKEFI